MRLHLLAAGRRLPAWINDGYQDYAARMPPECRLVLKEIPLGARPRGGRPESAMALEGRRMLSGLPTDARIITLEVLGRTFSTEAFARELDRWLHAGGDVALLIGGPDGLAEDCLSRSDLRWSLSPLTFPHGLVRVLVAEQLYRAWTVLQGHPYHRG